MECSMRKSLVLFAALAPASALAWETPQACVEALDVNMSLISNIQGGTSSEMFDVITSHGPYSPYNAPSMCLMSTGLVDNILEGLDYDYPGVGFDTSEGDRATLAFSVAVPQYAQSFSFNSLFCSREYPEWVGSAYNDAYEVQLASGAYSGQIVFDQFGNLITVNSGFFQDTDPVFLNNTGVGPPGASDGGCTGWVTTIAPCVGGETMQIEFTVYDVADGVWDSYVLIDNLAFSEDPAEDGPTTDDETPEVPMEIAFISPKEGDLGGGDIVNIYGAGFDNEVTVYWGDVQMSADDVQVQTGGDTLEVANIPAANDAGVAGGGTVDITLVRGAEEVALGAAYTYHDEGSGTAAPRIELVSPGTSNLGGDAEVVITGRHFVLGADEETSSRVYFDDAEANSALVHSDGNQIMVRTPEHQGEGWVTVTVVNPDGQVSDPGYPFEYRLDGTAGGDDDDGGSANPSCSTGGGASSWLALLGLGFFARRARKGVR
jgi:MYXO-CTERM domain-containing protein